ncbi:amidohydrolase [Occallatibacter savannae]|uniref:amidohydrolase n=1 Tax=Occallatibacter savannae TaxID=1002691 RepID=UPI000D69833A|nr:amidohydrolase [Occallatibacter savannae]
MRTNFALLAVVFSACILAAAQTPARHATPQHTKKAAAVTAGAPDDLFFNGVIYTGEGFADDKPRVVEAMAVSKGKIVAVGTTAEITRLAGPSTHLHDLDTAHTHHFIFPGFNDAHTHLGEAGREKLNVDLRGTGSLAEMLSRIQAAAAAAPAGHWLTGGGWDHTLWKEKVLPTRQDLDKVTGDHPAFLSRIDGHIAIANTAALKAAGITAQTKMPEGGAVDLDKDGEPTGIVRESAQELVEKVIPPPTHEERRKGDELAIEDALAHGVTSAQDNSAWEDFLVYEEMEKEGNLHLRISEWLPFAAPLEVLKAHRAHHDANDAMLHTGMLKGFMDGSLGSHTAAMKAPYSDDPKNTGLPQYTQERLNQMTVERAKAGFQIGFHAIGDKAVSMALDAFAQSGVPETARNRVEHAQVVDAPDFARFKKLGVIASMQPNHLMTDVNWAMDRIGPERAKGAYAWKRFVDAGVPLAFGTDYPVEPITPFRGLFEAVTRTNEYGTKSLSLENKLTRGQALYAYTQGSAYAEFAEKHKGNLTPGFDADFVIVDRDIYKLRPSAVLETQVRQTWVAGQQVHSSSAQ